jgi:hypothetical protein
MTIKVEFDPSEVFGSYGSTLAEAVVEACADRVMKEFVRDDALQAIRKRVNDIQSEEIRKTLEPVISEAVAAAVQPTDGFGTAKGPALTLREVIRAEAVRLLTKTEYNRKPYVAEMISKEVGHAVERELKAALDEGKTQNTRGVEGQGSRDAGARAG